MVKKGILIASGVVCLIVGMALVLAWWPQVVELFQGATGMVLALLGMILLYAARE